MTQHALTYVCEGVLVFYGLCLATSFFKNKKLTAGFTEREPARL